MISLLLVCSLYPCFCYLLCYYLIFKFCELFHSSICFFVVALSLSASLWYVSPGPCVFMFYALYLFEFMFFCLFFLPGFGLWILFLTIQICLLVYRQILWYRSSPAFWPVSLPIFSEQWAEPALSRMFSFGSKLFFYFLVFLVQAFTYFMIS